jgi:predicted transcriptional regulator of viral defense system
VLDNEQTVAEIASRQYGVISVAQLVDLGLTRQAVAARARDGRLHRLHRGVYAVGHRHLTTEGRWLAAVLASGPSAVLSHRHALALWQLRPHPSGPIDITVLSRGRRRRAGIRFHCVRVLAPQDVTVVNAIPVTSVPRTLLDYARTATTHQLRTALEAAERLELFDGGAIHALLDRSPGKATTKIRTVLAEMTGTIPWSRSELERQFLELIREAGLPEPQVNMSVTGAAADFYWPAQRLVVEADSWGFHRTRAQFEEDRRRDAQRTLDGLRTIRLTQRRMQQERTRVQAGLRALLEHQNLL